MGANVPVALEGPSSCWDSWPIISDMAAGSTWPKGADVEEEVEEDNEDVKVTVEGSDGLEGLEGFGAGLRWVASNRVEADQFSVVGKKAEGATGGAEVAEGIAAAAEDEDDNEDNEDDNDDDEEDEATGGFGSRDSSMTCSTTGLTGICSDFLISSEEDPFIPI